MELLETLLRGVRSACATFPDKRRGDVTYSMADIGLSAFSLFFMQSELFLAHQRALEDGRKMSNCQSLFGMTAVPTDNHIRAMLAPVPPSHLQPAFDQTLDMLRRHGGLRAFQRRGGRVLTRSTARNTSARKSSAVRSAWRAGVATARPRTTMPCWLARSWRPATPWPCP